MRAVIQRVSEAKVTIAGAIKGAIQKGLLLLLAVEEADTPETSNGSAANRSLAHLRR